VFGLLVAGDEFLHWWDVPGETLDNLGMLWVPLTAAAGWAGWFFAKAG
jgi:hypothetical protein